MIIWGQMLILYKILRVCRQQKIEKDSTMRDISEGCSVHLVWNRVLLLT